MSDIDAGADAPANEFVAAEPQGAAAQGTGAPNAIASATGSTAATPSMDDTMRAVWNQHHQDDPPGAARDDARAAGADRQKVSPDQTAEAAREQGGPDRAEHPAIAPPFSWTGEMKAKWSSLPPEFRDLAEYAAKRDREQHDAISRAGQQIKAYEPIRGVIERFSETFRRNNLQPADAIARMLVMEQRLGHDAKSAIADIAQAYEVDLRELTGEGAAAGTQDDVLHQRLAETRRELAQVKSYLTAQQQSEAQAQEAALARQVADFAKDKPHFEAVRRHMGALMSVDESLTLDDAYERATYALPDIRNRILNEQRKADEDKRAEDARRKAADARKSAQVNVKSSGPAGATPRTIDDTLQDIARRAYA
jgi:hypothetical protein